LTRPRRGRTCRVSTSRSCTSGPPQGDAEQISINLQAVPSFEAFGRFLETANPFAFWAQAARLAWFPWLAAATSAIM
jgi:hypothetical protein